MRLLALDECDLESGHLSLRTFIGTDTLEYAILSHRWTDDEVLFHDVEQGTSIKRKGYSKLRGAIEQARADGFVFLWDDTCCIDKSSSAELSEAINSMWAWYRDSSICYAYLDDVSSAVEDADFESEFKASAWFTRGWTLQELIAPRQVNFYNNSWALIGTKRTLQGAISEATGIDDEYLNHTRPLSAASVAKRMSWAAHRKTTRPEDAAYCLMGLFSINMPMLYGEASRAFQRLQEEILKSSDDESIFAWLDEGAKAEDTHGLLADCPFFFKNAGDIGPMLDLHEEMRRPWRTTNLGFNIERSLEEDQMPLFCGRRGQRGYLSVTIKRVGDQAVRCNLAEMRSCLDVRQYGDLYFPQEVPQVDQFLPPPVIRYYLRTSKKMHKDYEWSNPGQTARLHPWNGSLKPNNDKSLFFFVPKQGTFVDSIAQFTNRHTTASISVFIGVVNGSELGFMASTDDVSFVKGHGIHLEDVMADYNSAFARSALPIGSTAFVADSHCVLVKRLPPDPDPDDFPGLYRGEMEDLEVVITPMAKRSNAISPTTSALAPSSSNAI